MLDEDELELIWRQAEELRDETRGHFLDLHSGAGNCPNPACGCYLHTVATRDGDTVCSICGWVCTSGNVALSFSDGQRAHRAYWGYNPLFHLNERIANLNCTDPHLPDDLFGLVRVEHACGDYPADAALWYGHVGQILRSIIVPHYISEKYRGKRYTCSPLTDMCKKFHERWITLRYRLTGFRPKPLESPIVRGMQQRLVAFIAPWNKLRHSKHCKGGQKCHKRWGCRFKLPDCALLLWLFMHDIGGRELAEVYQPFLFYDGTPPTEKASEHMLRLIATCFRWNGWQAAYDDGSSKWLLEEYKDREWATKHHIHNDAPRSVCSDRS